MAAQTLVEQSIVFISPTGEIDQDAILANSLIQTFAANSAASDVIISNKSFLNWNGSTWTSNSLLEITGFVSTAFQATVQSNMATLQASFPQYTITTWGNSVSFGF